MDAVPASSKLPLGELQADSSVALLHAEDAVITELMRSLGVER